MAPTTTKALLLSPAELSYLHSSLSLKPPIRPDARNPTQFRPLLAETDILPGTNGSARICFADGTEAIVGVKAEVEKGSSKGNGLLASSGDVEMGEAYQDARSKKGKGDKSWVEMTIEIPGYRDDDALPVYLAAMLNEALLATGELADKLWINARFHWKLHIDVCSPAFPNILFEVLFLYLGPAPFTTTFVPSTSLIPDYTPCPALYTPTCTCLRSRGRPALQRRLGCRDSIIRLLESLTVTTSHHLTGRIRRT